MRTSIDVAGLVLSVALLFGALTLEALHDKGSRRALGCKETGEVRGVSYGSHSRSSERIDERGRPLPPWTQHWISFGGFSTPLTEGDSLTVVPMGADLPSKNYPVAGVEGYLGPEGDSIWAMESIEIDDEEYLRAAPDEPGFSLFIMYPAVEQAHSIDPQQFEGEWPDGLTTAVVRVVISTTNDDQPNIVGFEYCCDDEGRSPYDTKYGCDPCGAFYGREEGEWRLLELSHSC